mmetsp:Transcript_20880/g.45278  ORF Transcript_20880/g.45278 Transcript_20880/m.45278 type:complete len:1249 (+) Transcript_20880:63-3809(+)|eukprot:CAMPEP_0168783430 /NCGR_PEP_ID=MMETSP0725-20121227/9685_1 /TAXON_ID=265536 /ORGANISM="Amphiprora sp., Strain CCMP467" /LENGTH=1248 /DNA_ID=CAMNT_0008833413 /DNA_START=23 /DNA_END=3769 /DNA_ORIENTATION=-
MPCPVRTIDAATATAPKAIHTATRTTTMPSSCTASSHATDDTTSDISSGSGAHRASSDIPRTIHPKPTGGDDDDKSKEDVHSHRSTTNSTDKHSAAHVDHASLSLAVLNAVIDPTLVIGEEGIIVYFNPAACTAFGIDAATAIGSNLTMLMANETDAQHHDDYMKAYLNTGQKKMIGRNRTVTAKRCDDGSTWEASLSISEVHLEDGKRYFVGSLRDVTESIQREKLFSSVIDEAIDAIFTINERGIITMVNRAALKMFRYPDEAALLGQNVSTLMPEKHRAQHDRYISQHMQSGVRKMIGTDRTVTARRQDGTEFQCRLGLSKLKNNNDPTKANFVGLLHDLTHELAAREADARAELADKMRQQKSLFLASMSHEIRTPLNGIFGMLELLRSTELNEVQTEWLATCSRSAQSLTTILDDILLFSRADGGGITLERLSYNVRDAVEDAICVLASQTIDKPVDLVYTISKSVPVSVIGDPTRLRQVMLIFLSNALKFTSVGHVALEVSVDGIDDDDSSDDDEDGDHHSDSDVDNEEEDKKIVLKFEISDTGIGMTKKQIKKLFQPFTQADHSTTRQYGGTGLGLSIADKLVNLMDGGIHVESRPNRGSTFTFTASMEKDPDSIGGTASDLLDSIPESDMELLKGTHILSIDDNAVNTDYLVNLLNQMGCDVTGARSGVDGIELAKLAALREDPYEILLLDFAMPSMSGLEVAEIIAASQTLQSTKLRVIMLGSIDVHRSIAACPHVHGFTTKPIRRQPLIKMIIEQLKIKRGMLWAPTTKGPRALRENHGDTALQPIPDAQESVDEDASSIPREVNLRAQRPNPLSILYVEDNLINQKVIVGILSRWKVNVTTALNGLDGFEQRVRKDIKYDLILCDLHMPMADGFQCVQMIREWEIANNEKHVPICALTADASSDTKKHCLSKDGGFDKFLSKPLRKNVLRDTVISVCGSERLQSSDPSAPRPVPKKIPEKPVRQPATTVSSENGSSSSTGVSVPGTHILIVDDAPTMRLLMKQFLLGMGCTVSEAQSGEMAVEKVKSSLSVLDNPSPIEMVFCDMRMPPGMGGLETSMSIKSIPGAQNLPIIGMTADEVPHSAFQEAKRAGMTCLLSKPLDRTQLASFLAEHTGTLLPTSQPTPDGTDIEVFNKEAALVTCDGNEEFLKSLLTDFCSDLRSRKTALEVSIQRKDCARVAEIAHNIKGIAGVCSFLRLAQKASDCQKFASESNYLAVRSKVQDVLEEISMAIRVAENI